MRNNEISNPTATESTPPPMAYVYLRKDLSDDSESWMLHPEIQPTSVQLVTAQQGPSNATFVRPYGEVAMPWDTATRTYSQVDLSGYWIKVTLGPAIAAKTGSTSKANVHANVIFMGKIPSNQRRMMATNDGAETGVQTFTAEGPRVVLDRLGISQAKTYTDQTPEYLTTIDRIPPINQRDDEEEPSGNRSATWFLDDDGRRSYIYQEGEINDWTPKFWTFYDYLEYILVQFVKPATGLDWTIGGQVDVLKRAKFNQEFKTTQTATEILNQLITRKLGLDWVLGVTDAGFEVHVFSLTDKTWTFSSVDQKTGETVEETIKANTNTTAFTFDDATPGTEVVIAEDSRQKYGKIRILGKPIVICCTLAYSLKIPSAHKLATWGTGIFIDDEDSSQNDYQKYLTEGWEDDLETEYRNPPLTIEQETSVLISPQTSQAIYESARQKEKYRSVYRRFVASDMFKEHLKEYWSVHCYPNGEIITKFDTAFDQANLLSIPPEERIPSASFAPQTLPPKTLDWIPLYNDRTYTEEGEEVHTSSSDEKKRLRPPQVLVGGFLSSLAYDSVLYEPIEKAGSTVVPLDSELGIELEHTPNHLLTGGYTFDALGGLPARLYRSYTSLVATVAFEADQRFYIEIDLDNGCDGVKEIEVEDAEAWLALPGTVLEVKQKEYNLAATAPEDALVYAKDTRFLRYDLDKLQRAAASAVSRYGRSRVRGSIRVPTLKSWQTLVMYSLTGVQDSGTWQTVAAPITSVQWTFPQGKGQTPVTQVNFGYAR